MSAKEASETVQENAGVTELEVGNGDEKIVLSASSEEQPGRDRLTTLLPELLTIIFELVGKGDHRKPICRKLLWYTRKSLYKSVCLDSRTRLHRFARTVIASAGFEKGEDLGSLVEHLSFADYYVYQEQTVGEDIDCAALLKALPSITSLSLSQCEPLMMAVLSSTVADNYLQNLRELDLGKVCPSSHVFDARHFANLGIYPSLDKLHLLFCIEFRNRDGDLLSVNEGAYKTYPELPVQELYTGGDLHDTSQEQLSAFLAAFTRLRTLSFDYEYSTMNLNTVFTSVTSKLESLEVHCDYRGGIPLSDCLTRFATLKTLYLGYHAYDETTLISLRHCISLEQLSLGSSVYPSRDSAPGHVSYVALSAFLREGVRPPPLRELCINFFDPREDENKTFYLEVTQRDPTPRGQDLRWWPTNLTYGNAVSLMKEAEAVGVMVTGAVPQGIDIQSRWNESGDLEDVGEDQA